MVGTSRIGGIEEIPAAQIVSCKIDPITHSRHRPRSIKARAASADLVRDAVDYVCGMRMDGVRYWPCCPGRHICCQKLPVAHEGMVKWRVCCDDGIDAHRLYRAVKKGAVFPDRGATGKNENFFHCPQRGRLIDRAIPRARKRGVGPSAPNGKACAVWLRDARNRKYFSAQAKSQRPIADNAARFHFLRSID